jgi:hypothetical protein
MPTWRGANSYMVDGTSYEEELKLILSEIDSCLDEDQLLYVNLHPILKNSIEMEEYSNIFSFPKNIDNYEFLSCTDMLITDYSSVFFDYAATQKPILLFMYDFDAYMQERGTYFDPRKLPFKWVNTTGELVEALKRGDVEGTSDKIQNFIHKYCKYESENASRDVLKYFFHGVSNELVEVSCEGNKECEFTLVNMPKIIDLEHMDKIYEQHDSETALYVFEKENFDSELNSFLFEKYNDKITFIVSSKEEPCTYFEKIGLRLFNSKRIARNLNERESLRVLPNLKIKKIINEATTD